jgi:hypothetical protein
MTEPAVTLELLAELLVRAVDAAFAALPVVRLPGYA